ncbi:hypothetical protein M409DRAFT_60675 [Zasmidium cellare ATCC 36951]|uniref:S1/P1 nuclease n=1 Tax=Zasmidium cellare ATCC 36951 TaxID=1080233 RepID=A0A6A6C1L9_ZASCE|nr:uncharacterized protein M409DRAFT_60675 [Zasmidium cellare ATCC 36951]KAF2159606.1 hypothetical protein M409DRAFT_60675 [Zasmidium cellare ATCC 36951]
MRPSDAFSHLLIYNLAGTAFSWGDLGHRTTAYLAELYLTDDELRAVQHNTGFDDISDAAVWPDQVSKTPEYSYTASWHYLNVHDDPPSACGIELPRDHQPGSSDILTAFVNHSKIATSKHSSAEQLSEAFRFLLHWVGDSHQPLHAEGFKRGGGEIPVLFEAEPTNLHIVWDVHIPEKLRGQPDQRQAAKDWAKELFNKDTAQLPSVDKTCSDPGHAFECVYGWMQEANQLVCSSVFAKSVYDVDLGGSYYAQAAPVVNHQIARAGKRLALWIKTVLNESLSNDSIVPNEWDQVVLDSPIAA